MNLFIIAPLFYLVLARVCAQVYSDCLVAVSPARLLRLLRLLLLRLRLLLLLLRLLLLHSSTLFVADDGCRDPRLPGRKLPP